MTSPLDRRQFLKAASVCVATGSAAAGADDAVAAIDAHTHFYDPTRPQGVPWPGKGDKELYRRVLPPEFQALTRKQNVGGTIAVEASPWLDDNQWLLDLAAREPFVVGVVGNLNPAAEGFAEAFKKFARDPLYRGIRINHGDLAKGLESRTYLKNLGVIGELDRELDVNGGPAMPADVAKLARALPELRIVINHAGNLPIDGKPVPASWLQGMKAAAEGKRVFCKVSALVEATGRTKKDAPAEVDFYRPVLDALWEVFGADRLIFASNWPVSDRAAPYARLFEIVHSYFQAKGKAALAKFLRDNAVAAYKPADAARKAVER
jgi:L-fuconolactonase